MRLSVFRSNKHLYCQIIDDEKGKTLCACSDKEITKVKSLPRRVKAGKKPESQKQKTENLTKIVIAGLIGEKIAEKAKVKKIKKISFDTGGYKYHGRIKALAEGARKGGLEF